MGLKKISVIVPVYNSQAFLAVCVDSILAQTYPELEVLLVDDGSTDNSGAICNAYQQQDSRVRVIHKENGGAASARNVGIEAASGDYVAFVDSDDWIEPDMYRQMMAVASEYDCDVVLCDCAKEMDDRQEVYTHSIRQGLYLGRQLPEEYYPTLLMAPDVSYPPTISNCLCLIRRALLDEPPLRYADGVRYSEDLLFGSELMLRAHSFYYMKEQCFYHYRSNPGSVTHTVHNDKWEQYLSLYTLIAERFSNVAVFDFSDQIDLCLLFFLYDAAGEVTGGKGTLAEKCKALRDILAHPFVKTLLAKIKVWRLPVSRKLKVITAVYKYRIGIPLLVFYFEKK